VQRARELRDARCSAQRLRGGAASRAKSLPRFITRKHALAHEPSMLPEPSITLSRYTRCARCSPARRDAASDRSVHGREASRIITRLGFISCVRKIAPKFARNAARMPEIALARAAPDVRRKSIRIHWRWIRSRRKYPKAIHAIGGERAPSFSRLPTTFQPARHYLFGLTLILETRSGTRHAAWPKASVSGRDTRCPRIRSFFSYPSLEHRA
jgi:hypothetical protein